MSPPPPLPRKVFLKQHTRFREKRVSFTELKSIFYPESFFSIYVHKYVYIYIYIPFGWDWGDSHLGICPPPPPVANPDLLEEKR